MTDASPPLDPAACSPGSSALLVGSDGTDSRSALEASVAAPAGTAVVHVTTTSGSSAATGLRERGVDPDALAIVDAAGGPVPDGIAGGGAVADPSNLSALGIEASDQLDRLDHRHDDVVVSLSDVADLVEAAGLPGTFRFLHIISARARSGDAVLVAAADGSRLTEEQTRTLGELFDEVWDLAANERCQ